MIAIINDGETDDGLYLYRLQINNDLICRFTHDRKKGLARCLRDAARAVDKWNSKKIPDSQVAEIIRSLGITDGKDDEVPKM